MRRLCATGLAMIGIGPGVAFPEPQLQPPQVSAIRERTFWVCDYMATTRGAHLTPVDICTSVTDELKHNKFGGDYERMVQWWHERKPDEHQKLRREERLQAELQAPGRPMTAR